MFLSILHDDIHAGCLFIIAGPHSAISSRVGASSALSVGGGRPTSSSSSSSRSRSRGSSTIGTPTSSVRSPTVRLNNGCELPLLGLGTWKSEPDQVRQAVKQAIQAGYRMIDCAHIYGNEAEIGEALQECFQEGICQREDLFITSKLWNDSHGGEAEVGGALQQTLDQLQLDYLDMYLSECFNVLCAETTCKNLRLEEHQGKCVGLAVAMSDPFLLFFFHLVQSTGPFPCTLAPILTLA